MKRKLLFGLLSAFSISVFADADSRLFSKTSLTQSSISADQFSFQECNAKIQGGADGFPWSVAKPFPWDDIQGVWKLRDGVVSYYLKVKVIRTTSNRKILNLSIVSEGNCSKPIAQGLGYVDFSARNVIRAIINDGSTKYQIKIAAFNVRDLEIDSYACGENVVVASIQSIGSFKNVPSILPGSSSFDDSTENVMLNKVPNGISSICRKVDSK